MHRNSQKRIYGDYVYFITCDVQDMNEFFNEEILCEFWIEELRLAKEIKKFELYAFCLNYEHFHFLIKPDNKIANYSQIMHFIKRHTSRNINIILGYNKIDLKKISSSRDVHIEGDIGQCRLQYGNNTTNESDDAHRHLQQEYDEITYQYRQKYIEKFGMNLYHPKFKWQKSFHDHIIQNENDLQNHWNYTMYNYSKHNLPENWKYTGLNYPELIDDVE